MKKTLVLTFAAVFAIFALFPHWQNAYAKEISFIYVNGSGNNDETSKDWFELRVNKLHPEIKKAFEDDNFSCEHLLRNGQDTIGQKPLVFFWGDTTKGEIEILSKKLNSTKMFSPRASQFLRGAITSAMHDAIWATKMQNMNPLVEKLHGTVMTEYNKGNEVVLFGYSAGSFVTYNYLLKKSKYVCPYEVIAKMDTPADIKELIRTTEVEKTCTDALRRSKLAFIDSSGELVLNQSFDYFKKTYPELDGYTQKYCAPDDAVKGIINFGSPFSLFYSEIVDFSKIMTTKSKLLYEYIIESGKFLITVNWSNDPLAFPQGKNLTFEDVEERLNMNIEENQGFVYDKSDQKSRAMFLLSHNSYFKNAKLFAKNVVEGYKEGYFNYYE